MTSSHRVTSTEGIPEGDGEDTAPRSSDHSRSLHWARLILCAAGITAAIAIWASGGPPIVASAVAAAAAGGAGWQITVNVLR
ncbi:hypothetical protein AB0E04_43940 [Streptomyces sp. NPDC048251]|uniref:hypothetical protein n=1 Tax=Streptomyces sp. NPDC048251 TaxID=3154501 RepID=UPI003431AFF6